MTFKLALDQNFPLSLVRCIESATPLGIELRSLGEIDPRLPTMADRDLIIALKQLDFDAMATNNYRILDVPEELTALLVTQLGFVAIRSSGHNPIKATGALLLELTSLPQRLSDSKRKILDLRFDARKPSDGWEYLSRIAERAGLTANELYKKVRPSPEELARPRLPD